jgi:hypothetical protein
MLRVNLMRLQLASGTVAYGRIPPVHRADLEGQLSVELTSSPRRRGMSAICASVRTSSFVHGLMTRRVVAFTVLADFVVLTAFFKGLGIIQGTPFERRSIKYAMWRLKDRRFDVLNSK